MEPPNDRIAKRRAEIAEQQAALDRKNAQRSAEDDERAAAIVDRGDGSAVRSAAFLVLIVVVAAGLIGLAVTLTRFAGTDFDDVKRQGTAQVTSCVRHGPITTKGFGYWDSCTATITWDDASTERVTVHSVFNSADIGSSVRVGDLGDYRTSRQLARADAQHRPWLAWIGYAVGVVAFIPVLIAVLSIRELMRFRRRR